MTNQTTPAATFRLRDQLTLDLSDVSPRLTGELRDLAEYLLGSGLISLDAMQARYDETHQGDESDGEGDESDGEGGKRDDSVPDAWASAKGDEPQTWARGEGIEVGATVEYVGTTGKYRGTKGIVTWVGDDTDFAWCILDGHLSFYRKNLQRIA